MPLTRKNNAGICMLVRVLRRKWFKASVSLGPSNPTLDSGLQRLCQPVNGAVNDYFPPFVNNLTSSSVFHGVNSAGAVTFEYTE